MPDQKEYYMRRALTLAARGAGHVDPNPMVGCVIVKDGRIIAEGWHEHIGGLHAERNAFAHCTEDAAGADLYVTLEPCCHWGRTPPCTDAVIEHRIRRVFVGCLDPNPLVAGKGAQILRDAGIEVKPTCAPQFMRIAEQIGVETRYTRGCLAGLTYCVVGSEGIVRACAYMTEDAGDVRKQPFDEIWRTSPVFQELRTQAYKGACGSCDYKGVCGGCRARAAYYHDGDILAQDDYCAWGIKSAARDTSGVSIA